MTAISTPNTPRGMALDVTGFAPVELVPDALILQASYNAGFVEGDEPSVRVPYIDFDADTGFVAEGANITEADPDYSEAVIHTGKIAVLARVSREQMTHLGAAKIVQDSMQRSIIRKADAAFLAQAAPTSPAVTPPAGLLNQSPTAGTAIANDLDSLATAVMDIEAANGRATHIIASPTAWASLTQFKSGTGSNASLVGAGVDAAARQLLGVPVLVSSAMTANTILVLDKSAVLSAAGQIQLAVSQDAYFTSDSVGIRVTWRFGQVIVDTARVVKLVVTAPAA